MMTENRILVVSNSIEGLISFRYELIEKLIQHGYEVHILAPSSDKSNKLKRLGCEIINRDFKLHGKNPVNEIKLLFDIMRYIRYYEPDNILTYTIKPNVYVGLINRFNKRFKHIANITGLGHSIMSPRHQIFGKMMLSFYVKSLENSKVTFVQNQMIYNKMKLNNKKINLITLPGSGVNIDRYYFKELTFNDNIRVITYLGRAIQSKGIFELLSAIEQFNLSNNKFDYQFIIIGTNDYIKTDISNVKIMNKVDDVRAILLQSHVIINPSHHEGMSNILLEGGSMGRMLMSSKIPGCEEITGQYGITFEAKNHVSLLESLKKLDSLTNSELAERGSKIRKHIEENFSRKIVISKYLNVISNQEEE